MARFARSRASRWVGGAGLRDVAPRTPPGDFFDTRKNRPPRDSKKVARRGSGHRRLLICMLFFLNAKRQPHSRSAQVLLLQCKTPTLLSERPSPLSTVLLLTSQPKRPSSFSSLQNTNLAVEAPKSPLHNSANAVMRMVVSCERSE